MKSFGIAAASLMETVRQPVYPLVLLIGSLLLFGSSWMTLFGFGREQQIVLETGVAGAVVCGLFIALVTVPGAIADEIRNRQILAILAKPIRSFDLIAGKFLGLGIALLAAFAVFGVMFGLSIFIKGGSLAVGSLAGAYFLAFLQVATIGAVVLFFSIWMPAPAAMLCAFAVYTGGNLLPYLSKKLEVLGTPLRQIGEGALLLLPDLLRLNASFDFASGRSASWLYLLLAALYAGIYVLFILAIASAVLARKEIA